MVMFANPVPVRLCRTPRGQNNHIPETVLPGFLDLVVWGHEHECLVDVCVCVLKISFIAQCPKYLYTLLRLRGGSFNSLRPFYFRSVRVQLLSFLARYPPILFAKPAPPLCALSSMARVLVCHFALPLSNICLMVVALCTLVSSFRGSCEPRHEQKTGEASSPGCMVRVRNAQARK